MLTLIRVRRTSKHSYCVLFLRTRFASWTNLKFLCVAVFAALGSIGIESQSRTHLMDLTAAILHIGNISFVEAADDNSEIDPATEKHLNTASELLQVTKEALTKRLTTRKIKVCIISCFLVNQGANSSHVFSWNNLKGCEYDRFERCWSCRKSSEKLLWNGK